MVSGGLNSISKALATEGQPAAKATAKVGDIHVLDSSGLGWTTVLGNTIKTANQKDLFIDVSIECGLYTQTKVKGQGGEKDSASSEALVKVRALVDGVEAYPGEVVFCNRAQTLTAVLGGVIVDEDGDGIIDDLTDEEIELVLDTMNANAFNFILDDLGSGVHVVEVQAMIDTSASAGNGSASATATIGNGSVTVEEVRMIQNEDILLSD